MKKNRKFKIKITDSFGKETFFKRIKIFKGGRYVTSDFCTRSKSYAKKVCEDLNNTVIGGEDIARIIEI